MTPEGIAIVLGAVVAALTSIGVTLWTWRLKDRAQAEAERLERERAELIFEKGRAEAKRDEFGFILDRHKSWIAQIEAKHEAKLKSMDAAQEAHQKCREELAALTAESAWQKREIAELTQRVVQLESRSREQEEA